MDAFRNVKYALAVLRRERGFTAAAILALALGIGATTAVFSAIYGVLLRPLPYPEPDRLVRIYEEHPGRRSLRVNPRRATRRSMRGRRGCARSKTSRPITRSSTP